MIDRRRAAYGLIAPALVGFGATATAAPAPVPVSDDNALGNPNAKITVVEYASVACPVCGRWYKDVFAAFKAKYIDTGKVHFIYREMLVGNDAEVALAAAGFLLARCAGRKNYFPVVDAIYQSQPGLFDNPNQVLVGVAKTVGLNQKQFDACIRDPASLKALDARVAANAKRDNINATPTFVINGKSMEPGYHPLTEIDAAIAAARVRK